MHKEDQEILDRNPMSARNYGFEFIPFKGDIEFLNDGDSVFLDEDELKVLFVPGHSPGSIAFYNENQKFVISGDALFQGSIGRTDLYRGNHSQFLESIKNKLFTLPRRNRSLQRTRKTYPNWFRKKSQSIFLKNIKKEPFYLALFYFLR